MVGKTPQRRTLKPHTERTQPGFKAGLSCNEVRMPTTTPQPTPQMVSEVVGSTKRSKDLSPSIVVLSSRKKWEFCRTFMLQVPGMFSKCCILLKEENKIELVD